MHIEKIKAAKAEAHRFLDRVEELESVLGKSSVGYLWGSKESGAVRRASMDLTRALADMRKSPYK